MKWQGRETSSNVDDRRGGGGGRKLGRAGAGVGVVGVIIAVVFALMNGQDPSGALRNMDLSPQPQATNTPRKTSAAEDEMAEFVSVVLKDCEDVWGKLFKEEFNEGYREPKMVLYTGGDESGCGSADARMGPFYCPADESVFIDLSFFSELKSKFNAPGDFAVAYVVAHEVGHHVQNLLGTSAEMHAQRQRVSEAEYNKLSVRLELQADFYAGVWAHHAQKMKNILDPGDVDEALGAAAAVGDDRLQKKSRGYVVEESFTHGTSEQRQRWFRKGFDTGDINQGDTFGARKL